MSVELVALALPNRMPVFVNGARDGSSGQGECRQHRAVSGDRHGTRRVGCVNEECSNGSLINLGGRLIRTQKDESDDENGKPRAHTHSCLVVGLAYGEPLQPMMPFL